jgi:hypothetical protein
MLCDNSATGGSTGLSLKSLFGDVKGIQGKARLRDLRAARLHLK